MLVEGVENVTYDELGEIELANGEKRRCKVLEIDGDNALVQLFESSTGINLANSQGRASWAAAWSWAFRRICSAASSTAWAVPSTAGPDILPEKRMDINGQPHEPGGPQLSAGVYPDRHFRHRRAEHPGPRAEAAHLLRPAACPTRNLAAQIARQAKVRGTDEPVRRGLRRHGHHL